MKRIFTAILTIFGFLGLASAILFSIMSPGWTFTPSNAALTADIGVNFFGNNAPAASAAAARPADTGTAALASSTVQNISAVQIPTTPPATPAPASSSATFPQPPSPAPDNNESGAGSDLPVATATITVTPTAPQLPQSAYGTEQSKNISASTSTGAGRSLPYDESNFAGDDDWKTTWGVATTTGSGFLQLSAGANSFGGAVYLANDADWSGYRMAVTLEPITGETFVLVANFTNASNYVFCEYDATGTDAATMQLGQYIEGHRIDLSPAVPVPWSDGATDIEAAIEVGGMYGTCSLGSETVSNEGIGPGNVAMNASGGGSIGIAVDDPSPDTSQVLIKHVTVTAE